MRAYSAKAGAITEVWAIATIVVPNRINKWKAICSAKTGKKVFKHCY